MWIGPSAQAERSYYTQPTLTAARSLGIVTESNRAVFREVYGYSQIQLEGVLRPLITAADLSKNPRLEPRRIDHDSDVVQMKQVYSFC